MVAESYPTLLECCQEMVQNAIDSKPTWIVIDANFNSRNIEVTDDGEGVSVSRFQTVLDNIGVSQKRDDKLGRFGRGIMSPAGKCRRFSFTSCPKRNARVEGYAQWIFDCTKIADTAHDLEIPQIKLPRLTFARDQRQSGRKHEYIQWRSRMLVEGVTTDKRISRLGMATLAQALIDRYGVAIRKQGINVWINYTHADGSNEDMHVTAPEFGGAPLKEVTYSTDDSGETIFKLFTTTNALGKAKKGKVSLGEIGDDSRIRLVDFTRVVGNLLDERVVTALRSGIFEGEIFSEKAELHGNRKQFLENDALAGLCICINTWFEQVGSKIFKEVKDQTQERRYQELGLRSMKAIDQMIKAMDLGNLFDKFKIGSTGKGHFDIGGRESNKPPAKAVQGSPGKKRPKKKKHSKKKPSSPPKPPSKDHPNHHPALVGGPDGKQRKWVRSNSTGLMVRIDNMSSKSDVFEMNMNDGVLTINSRHPLFANKVKDRDTYVMKYTEAVAAMALSLLQADETSDVYMAQKRILEDHFEFAVHLIVNADRVTERVRPGGKSSKEEDSNGN
tara:strand:+ start:10574 stop:12247 length:1674 start_codon:yes stop_codon:yes gene_type:complete